jgi:general secretion pathway protein G
MQRNEPRRQRGMTLIELLLVMAILAFIGGIVTTQIWGQKDKADQKGAKVQIDSFSQPLGAFRLDVGRYPTTAEGLDALVKAPSGVSNWHGPYLSKNVIPKDPWGNEYKYSSPGAHGEYDIVSLGADGREGGEGKDADVTSWQ